jgi:hypothetical protein
MRTTSRGKGTYGGVVIIFVIFARAGTDVYGTLRAELCRALVSAAGALVTYCAFFHPGEKKKRGVILPCRIFHQILVIRVYVIVNGSL